MVLPRARKNLCSLLFPRLFTNDIFPQPRGQPKPRLRERERERERETAQVLKGLFLHLLPLINYAGRVEEQVARKFPWNKCVHEIVYTSRTKNHSFPFSRVRETTSQWSQSVHRGAILRKNSRYIYIYIYIFFFFPRYTLDRIVHTEIWAIFELDWRVNNR